MSAFTDILAAGLAASRAVAGDQVTYHAGATAVVVDQAVEGKTEYESLDQAGATVTAIATDFLIAVADLPGIAEPLPGHWIEKSGRRFELAYLGREPCYRFSDPGRTTYRIHTKEQAGA